MSPQRIQRKRTKGWTTPLCSCGCGRKAIYVGRPTKWANPYKIKPAPGFKWGCWFTVGEQWSAFCDTPERAHAVAVHLFKRVALPDMPVEEIEKLRGHDLMCWCPSEYPCHADVLLELSNGF